MGGIRSFFVKRRVLHALSLFGIFFILTVVATYPLILYFNSHLPGFMDDEIINSWILWWVRLASTTLHVTPFSTKYQFYPMRIDISGDISVFYSAISVLTTSFFNYIAMYNTRVFLSFVITGMTMYWWLYRATKKNPVAALAGSIVFTFSFYRLVRALTGHIDLASTEWYGLLLIFLFSAASEKKLSVQTITIGVIGSSLLCYTDYRNTLFLIIYSCIFSIFYLIITLFKKEFLAHIRNFSHTILIVCVISGIICLPLIMTQSTKISLIQNEIPENSGASLQSLVIREQRNPYTVNIHNQQKPFVRIDENSITFVGMVACALCVFSILLLMKRMNTIDMVMLFTTVVCVLLTIGFWEPIYDALYGLGIFRPFRIASRFIVLVEIGFAYFIARGCMEMNRILTQKKQTLFIGASAFCVIVLFFESSMMPIHVINVSPLASLSSLSQKPGTVLEIPFGFRDATHRLGEEYVDILFVHQISHRRPIIGGYMSFVNDDVWERLKKDTVIKKLLFCQQYSVCTELSSADKMRLLSYYNVRHIIINRNYFDSAIHSYLKEQLYLKKTFEDTSVIIYEFEEKYVQQMMNKQN